MLAQTTSAGAMTPLAKPDMPLQPQTVQTDLAGPQYWKLENADTTVLVGNCHAGGVPSLIWYGATLTEPETMVSSGQALLVDALSPPTPHASLDVPAKLNLFPAHGSGYMGSSAIAGHRGGQHFAPQFCLESVSAHAEKLMFRLVDQKAQLILGLVLSLDPDSSVLDVNTTLENSGDTFQLDWLASATLPLDDLATECTSLHGRWGAEFKTQTQNIGFNRLQIENLTGRTSHEHFPGCIVGHRIHASLEGHVLGMHLGWSGNHRTTLERLSNGKAYLQTGAVFLPGEILMSPGERITMPTAHFCSADGINQMSQRFHQYARSNILPPWTRSARPIHANSWEALYFDHSTNALIELVNAAAKLGAERFVLDDGWFKGRRDDTAGLGDWFVDEEIYPEGLHPLVKAIREQNMQFGLWFEPEMVNPDSDLFRHHPEWALHLADYESPLARHQLALNMDLQAVQDYLFGCISNLVEEYNIDYIKWDMNRDLAPAANGHAAKAFKQPLGCYQLIDKLSIRYPDLEIETCASGGARADFGILHRTGRVWASDNIDPIDRLSIHGGFQLFFPPEIMGAHVGHERAHLTGRVTDLDTRAIIALQGQFGFELDVRKLTPAEAETLAYYSGIYKSNREWMNEGKIWKQTTRNAQLVVRGIVSQDANRSFWFVCTEGSLIETMPERLLLKGLAPDKQYSVSILNKNLECISKFSKRMPAWTETGTKLSGELLMKIGLSLPVLPAQTALLVECTECSLNSGINR